MAGGSGGNTSGRDSSDSATAVPGAVESVATAEELAGLLRWLRRRDARRRGRAELTYREVAAKTGWSFGIVGQYFAGKILPPTDRFDTLIRLLGASPAEQGPLATARDRVEEHRRAGRPEPSRAVPHEPPAPRQLPPAARHFAGRGDELAALGALLEQPADPTGGPLVVTVDGTAGVGKTALAVQWARGIADRYPDGQLYANLRGFDPTGTPLRAEEVLRGFLDALGVAAQRIPAGLDARAAQYRSELSGRRVLVLLDNVADAEQVRPLLPGAAGCLVIVTSRNRLTSLTAVHGAQPLTLGLLSAGQARDLLCLRLGPVRIAAEPDAVDEIVSRCAGLPLALGIAAARAATQHAFPLAALAAELREARGCLEPFDGGDPATDLRAVFSWSYRRLGATAGRLFRLLAVHAGPDVGVAAAASLAGSSTVETRGLLRELTQAHLAYEPAPGRYALHDLMRGYAAELTGQLDTVDDRRAATSRCVEYYLNHAYRAAQLLRPHADGIPPAAARDPAGPDGTGPDGTVPELADAGAALDWLGAEYPALCAVVGQAAGAGYERHAWWLARLAVRLSRLS